MIKTEERVEAVVGTIALGVFLVLFNVYYERIEFLTADFDEIRGIYNLSIFFGVVTNAVQIFFQPKWFKWTTQVISNIFFVVIAYQFWHIFPFDTSVFGDTSTWDPIFRGLIIIPTCMFTFATLVEGVQLIFKQKKSQ